MKQLILRTIRAMSRRRSVLGFVLVCKHELHELECKVETMDGSPDSANPMSAEALADPAFCDQLEATLRDTSARMHREDMPAHSAVDFNAWMVKVAQEFYRVVEKDPRNAGGKDPLTTQRLALIAAGQLYYRRAAYQCTHETADQNN